MHSGLTDNQLETLAIEHGTPLLIVDCKKVEQQFASLKTAFLKVDFYYAVKAFPNAEVVKTLHQCGAGFDVASTGEIELIRSLYINPRSCIHTHPIKKHADIREALRFGCTTFVVDNLDELKKFKQYRHRVGLLLRVSFRNPNAVVDLSRKFGCPVEEASAILMQAKSMGIHVKGLSFHVGSQSGTSDTHVAAINHCASIISQYNQFANIPMSILNIGGGFPVAYEGSVKNESGLDIEEFCAPIRAAIDNLNDGIQVIAEPGRFLVAPAATAVSSVVGKAKRDGKQWYYLDDGVYGNYSGQMYDHATYPVRCLKQGTTYSSVLAGPTCDSIDIVREDIQLPDLDIGDLIVGEVMGAYTAATATDFNSLARSKIIILNENSVEQTVFHIA